MIQIHKQEYGQRNREMNVLIAAKWMCFSFEELTDEYDRIIIFKEPVSDKALTGHVIRTEKVTDAKKCQKCQKWQQAS